MKAAIKRYLADEMGGGLVEYTLILALVALVCATVLTTLQGKITTTLTSISTAL